VSGEITTPDLVDLTRRMYEAIERGDLDAVLDRYAPEAIWRGTVDDAEGVPAIRALWVGYFSAFEELRVILDDVLDFGNGVILAATRHVGRLVGGGALAEDRTFVNEWVDGRVVRAYDYTDTDEARAAAARLAEERGWAMSENLDLVRSIYASWQQGDFTHDEWADPDIDFIVADGPQPTRASGWAGMAESFRTFMGAWEDFTIDVEEYRQLDPERVLVLIRVHRHGRRSGAAVEERRANLLQLANGKVTSLVSYWDRDRALADLGLEE
jgi:ketosteroid isomerase-like protein